jgi:hypothetical protein
MTLLKTVAATIVIAGLSVLPAVAAEARLLEQVGESGVEQQVGTLEWRETLDETGAPGLAAIITIDEAQLAAEVTLVKNNDPALPASHIFNVTFAPGEGFEGAAVVQLAGVMMRKGEDLQGTPLPGARTSSSSPRQVPRRAAPSSAAASGWTSRWSSRPSGARSLLSRSTRRRRRRSPRWRFSDAVPPYSRREGDKIADQHPSRSGEGSS